MEHLGDALKLLGSSCERDGMSRAWQCPKPFSQFLESLIRTAILDSGLPTGEIRQTDDPDIPIGINVISDQHPVFRQALLEVAQNAFFRHCAR